MILFYAMLLIQLCSAVATTTPEIQFALQFGGKKTTFTKISATSTLPDASVLVCGIFTGSVSFGDTILSSRIHNGQVLRSSFVAKVMPSGIWSWAVSIGNEYYNEVTAIDSAPDGESAWITGIFQGSISFGATTFTHAKEGDYYHDWLFVARISTSSGSWLSATSPSETIINNQYSGWTRASYLYGTDCLALQDGSVLVLASADVGRDSQINFGSLTFVPQVHDRSAQYTPLILKISSTLKWEWLLHATCLDYSDAAELVSSPDGKIVYARGYFQRSITFQTKAGDIVLNKKYLDYEHSWPVPHDYYGQFVAQLNISSGTWLDAFSTIRPGQISGITVSNDGSLLVAVGNSSTAAVTVANLSILNSMSGLSIIKLSPTFTLEWSVPWGTMAVFSQVTNDGAVFVAGYQIPKGLKLEQPFVDLAQDPFGSLTIPRDAEGRMYLARLEPSGTVSFVTTLARPLAPFTRDCGAEVETQSKCQHFTISLLPDSSIIIHAQINSAESAMFSYGTGPVSFGTSPSSFAAVGESNTLVAKFSPVGNVEWVSQGGQTSTVGGLKGRSSSAIHSESVSILSMPDGSAYITGSYSGVVYFGSFSLSTFAVGNWVYNRSSLNRVPDRGGF